jgi:hypothetical protein
MFELTGSATSVQVGVIQGWECVEAWFWIGILFDA